MKHSTFRILKKQTRQARSLPSWSLQIHRHPAQDKKTGKNKKSIHDIP